MDPMFLFQYGLHQVMILAVPLLMLAIIALAVIRSLKEWHHHENSPRLTVQARIVTKRSEFRRTMSNKINIHRHSRTNYYVTFEVESGDRMELEMAGPEYGLLVEGDQGKLTFQGTRYLSFERM